MCWQFASIYETYCCVFAMRDVDYLHDILSRPCISPGRSVCARSVLTLHYLLPTMTFSPDHRLRNNLISVNSQRFLYGLHAFDENVDHSLEWSIFGYPIQKSRRVNNQYSQRIRAKTQIAAGCLQSMPTLKKPTVLQHSACGPPKRNGTAQCVCTIWMQKWTSLTVASWTSVLTLHYLLPTTAKPWPTHTIRIVPSPIP